MHIADKKYSERLKEKFVPFVEEIIDIAKEIADEQAEDGDTWIGVFLSVATSCIMMAIHDLVEMYRTIHRDAIEWKLPVPPTKSGEGEKLWLTRWLKGNRQKEN